MSKGYLCIVLHAHLPFIRHPEQPFFLEENWLFEAMTESYIPLMKVFERLINDDIDFHITLSLSPTLVTMLYDKLLKDRYKRYLEHVIEISERELKRTAKDIHINPVAAMYLQRFRAIQKIFEDEYNMNLINVFANLQRTKKVELITTSATHAFLPVLDTYPFMVEAQVRVGIDTHRKYFGTNPRGFWLPECGYKSSFDQYLKKHNISFFFLDSHAVTCGDPVPAYGVYAPVLCPSGMFAFGRDTETSQQVWSSASGYPGDFEYRDFYRDIGFDITTDYIRKFLSLYGGRTYTGLKYYRITGKSDVKKPYRELLASKKVHEHARHFVQSRISHVKALTANAEMNPLITSLYDAELFGHWWFEGPDWLEAVLRGIDQEKRYMTTMTASQCLKLVKQGVLAKQCSQPLMSSWGARGFHESWINPSNDYMYRHIHKAIEMMSTLAESFPRATGNVQRALNQAAREILLSQHSDWAFMMKSDTYTSFGRKSFVSHINNFHTLYEMIMRGNVCENNICTMEERGRIFPEIDYRIFKTNK
jgi:1,4-alpha-glucan branching enzyme